jgi:hypothetical protein
VKDWLDALVEVARERRTLVAAFETTQVDFLAALLKQIHLDTARFVTHFPDEEIHIVYFPVIAELAFKVSASTPCATPPVPSKFNPRRYATVRLDALKQRICYRFENSGEHWGWREILYCSEGEIHLIGRSQSDSVNYLSARILMPILFPFLDQCVVDSYLKR